ncbi:SCO family protein [uncultured Thiodictyon sp.]|jgi:protein SCO1/2|uniref:SCO family protein n=1 Tax=uncultured Thiodictyon sp. TaxID=1846217 RepID=UPI0025EABE8F|nr:SCO family protein [uncultured Thiodictyon sp.]
MLHPRPVLTNRFLLVSLVGLSGVASMAPGGPWADEHTGPPPAEAAGHAHHHHHMPAVSRTTAAYAIPDVTLTDQNGRPIHLRTLLATDRPVMVNFIYTSCTAICPVMSGTFARVQESLGADSDTVQMLSISIDPEQDTPAELARYARQFKAAGQWHFLTGRRDDIVQVQRAFDAYRGDKMNHTPLTLVRPASAAQWVRYDGFADAEDLAREATTRAGS